MFASCSCKASTSPDYPWPSDWDLNQFHPSMCSAELRLSWTLCYHLHALFNLCPHGSTTTFVYSHQPAKLAWLPPKFSVRLSISHLISTQLLVTEACDLLLCQKLIEGICARMKKLYVEAAKGTLIPPHRHRGRHLGRLYKSDSSGETG
jgi:hypothetical protein